MGDKISFLSRRLGYGRHGRVIDTQPIHVNKLYNSSGDEQILTPPESARIATNMKPGESPEETAYRLGITR